MRYCSRCRREFSDSDICCPADGSELKSCDPEQADPCALCGRIVERGERVCINCGAKAGHYDPGFYPTSSGAERKSVSAAAGRTGHKVKVDEPWVVTRNEAPSAGIRTAAHSAKAAPSRQRTGRLLIAGGFVAGLALGLIILREVYRTNEVPIGAERRAQIETKEEERPAPPPDNGTPAIKPSENTPPASGIVRSEPQKPPHSQPAPAKAGQRAPAEENTAREGRREEALARLQIPSGVRIPSPEELRRRKLQHEAEQAEKTLAVPVGVEIPSPTELRRKRIEHAVQLAIQNRAIEGVTVSLIGNTVYLKGRVATERQKALAEQAAREVPEARNVRSVISVGGQG